MGSIDERIVKMTFDNSSFEGKISKTIESLEKLNEVLKNTGNTEAVNNISKSMKDIKSQISTLDLDKLNNIEVKESVWSKIGNALSTAGKGLGNFISKLDLGGSINKLGSSFKEAVDGSKGLDKNVESITARFSTLGIIGATALSNITNRVVDLGTKMLKSLTIEPLTTGFSEYELKMNSISTILANTADDGETLETVTAALNELNEYADDTIYNFAQMTDNIGKFTAAGVSLDDSVAAIKGMSNLAAFFGVDATKASGAMYQMSQALAAGKVQLMDWRSLINAGMSGEAFQKALIRTSEVMGTGADEMIKKYGSFNESLTKGEWLTADVMIETLKQISGAYKESELRAKGYSATQARDIANMAKTANKAATEVRTVTGMLDTMKESVQSAWAISWEYIIGDKDQATELLTGIKDGFESIINPIGEARNKMLEFWNQNGGRDATIKGFTNIFKDLGKVMGSIGDAWKEVFPSMTGERLVELSNKFKDFTEKIKLSDKTIGKIKDTFKGVFNVIKTVGSAVGSAVKAFLPITNVFPSIGNAVLSVTSVMGRFVSAISEAINKSQIFDKTSNLIKGGFDIIGRVCSGASKTFSSFFDYLGKQDFGKIFSSLGKGLSALGDIFKPVFANIGKALGTINFNTVMKAFQTATFIEGLKALKDTLSKVGGVADSFSGIGDSVKGVFSSLKGVGKDIKEVLNSTKEALEAWQKDLQAKTLLKIASAVGILAASLILLASVDAKSLAVSLGAMGVVFSELALAYMAIMKVGGVKGQLGVSASLISMATSMLILAGALKVISSLNVGEMLTGIVGILVILGTMSKAVKMFDKKCKNLKQTAGSLIIFGVALMTMAGALKMLGSIDAETLGAGLFAMAGVLTELAIFLKVAKFGELGPSSAIGIGILSVSLLVLAQALKEFGGINPNEILIGLASIAAILAEIGIFSEVMKESELVSLAVGLTAMSVALIALSLSMKSLGSMDWETLLKAMVGVAGGLLILSKTGGTFKDLKLVSLAVGIAAMGAALLVLGAAMKNIGSMSWEQVAVGLITLGGAMLILSLAMESMKDCIGAAAAFVVMAAGLAILTPQLLLLGQMDMNGVAVMLLALSGAFIVLGLAGLLLEPVVPALLGIGAAIALIGIACLAAGAGVAIFATGLATLITAVGAGGFVFLEFLRQAITLLPQLGLKMGEAFVNWANAIGQGAPQIIGAWTSLMTELLNSVMILAPQIAATAVMLITEFANALATGLPQLVQSGMEMILGILEGIAANIGQVVEASADVAINFMDGIAAKLPEIIDSGINLALSFIEGIAQGISDNSARLEAAIEMVIEAMVDAALAILNGAVTGFVDHGSELVQGVIDGMSTMLSAVASAAGEIIDWAVDGLGDCGTALWSAGEDLVKGFCNGIGSALSWVEDKASSIASAAKSAAEKALGIKSPSRVFMKIGKFTTQGFAVGLTKYSRMVTDSATNLAQGVIDNVQNPLSTISNLINGEIDFNPVITPVLDLSNVEQNSRRLGELVSTDGTLSLSTDKASIMGNSIGQIQNGPDNRDIVSALKDLKASMADNRPSYTVNGITYDDGSNIVNAVESLVRAAKIERRI